MKGPIGERAASFTPCVTAVASFTTLIALHCAPAEAYGAAVEQQPLDVASTQLDNCPPVSVKSSHFVSAILRSKHTSAKKYGPGSVESFRSAANKYNMHIYDPTQYIEDLDAADSIESAIALTQPYFEQLGISVGFEVDNESHTAITDEISTQAAKTNVRNVMQAFALIPKSAVKKLNLSRITIARNVYINGRGYGGTIAQAADGSNEIILESNTLNSSEKTGGKNLLWHELGHIFALNYCGPDGMLHDKIFTRLNNGANYSSTSSEVTVPKNDRNFWSPLAARSSAEDVAENNSKVFDGVTSKEALGSRPKNKKYRLELGRLAQLLGRGYLRYLVDALFIR